MDLVPRARNETRPHSTHTWSTRAKRMVYFPFDVFAPWALDGYRSGCLAAPARPREVSSEGARNVAKHPDENSLSTMLRNDLDSHFQLTSPTVI